MAIVGEAAAVRVRGGRAGLFVSTAMAGVLVVLGAPMAQAQALDACGPADASGTASCSPAGNPYPDGIHYITPPVTPGDDVDDPATPVLDLTVTLEDDGIVFPDANTGAPAIHLEGRNDGAVTLYAGQRTGVLTTGDYQTGVLATATEGDVTLYAPEAVVTLGDEAAGVKAVTDAGGGIGIASYSVSTSGDFSIGVYGWAQGGGDVGVTAYDTVSTGGDYAMGVFAAASDGAAVAEFTSVDTFGEGSSGVVARGTGGAVIAGGEISTFGGNALGALAVAQDGDAVIDLASVTTFGDDAVGAGAASVTGDAWASADIASTTGGRAHGVAANSTAGDATVVSSESISTEGVGAVGAMASAGRVATVTVKDVLVTGDDAVAVAARGEAVEINITGAVASQGETVSYASPPVGATVYAEATVNPANAASPPEGSGVAVVNNSGSILASGDYTLGVHVTGDNGVVVSGSGTIATTGRYASGIYAKTYGTTSIVQSRVTTEGYLAKGVAAEIAGDAVIEVEEIATLGESGTGVDVYGTGAGNVTVRTGSVSTGGYNAYGITVSSGGDVLIDGGSVVTSGDYSDGVSVEAEGDIAVRQQEVIVSGLGAIAVDATSQGGNVDIDVGRFYGGQDAIGISAATSVYGDGAVTVDAGYGYANGVEAKVVEAQAYGGGGVAVSLAYGAATGATSRVIDASTRGDGSVDIESGTLIGEGANSVGALAQAFGAGDVYVAADDVTQSGADAVGVRLRAMGGGDADAAVGSVVVTGARASGILGRSNYGDVQLTVDSVTGSGAAVYGVDAASDRGLASVTLGSADITGDGARGVNAVGDSALVTVTGQMTVDGAQAIAIAAGAAQTATVMLDGDIEIGGRRSTGLIMLGNGGAVLTGSGSIVTTGQFGNGAVITSSTGDVAIDFGSIRTEGELAIGLRVLAYGAVDVALDSARVYGAYSSAIEVQNRGEQDLTVNVADIYALQGNGVDAATRATADVTVGNVSVGGGYSTAAVRIVAGDAFATVNGLIDTQAVGTQYFKAAGVRIGSVTIDPLEDAQASGTVTNNGQIVTHGEHANGVYAYITNDVVITGPGAIVTHGSESEGVFARSTEGGRVSVSQGRIETGGDESFGVRIATRGDAAVDVGAIDTQGEDARAIDIRNSDGVDISAGSISTLGARANGVDIRARGDVALDLGSLDIGGDEAFGVTALTAGTVSATIDDLRTDGALSRGLRIAGASGVAIALTDGAASGVGSQLVDASAGGGDVTFTSGGTLSVSGDGSTLVNAESLYETAVAIHAGQVSGEGSRGVVATGAMGTAVTVGGAFEVTSVGEGSSAVIAESSDGAAAVTVTAGGAVFSPQDAIVMTSATGSTLSNAGRIDAGRTVALRVSGGAASVANSGTLTGALVLTDAVDTVTNTGTLTLAEGTAFGDGADSLANSGTMILAGDVDFGGGGDVFTNTGTVRLSGEAAPAIRLAAVAALAAPAQTRTLLGLETFNNAGLIDLRSGVAGDQLIASGAFSGGTGSVLALDVGADTADHLTIGGAATGVTRIVVEPLDGADASLQPGVALVSAGAGTVAGAFVLDDGSRLSGFIERSLVFDAATGGFTLLSAPNPTAYRLMKLGENAGALWSSSADAVAAHLGAARDAGDGAAGAWAEVSAGSLDRDQVREFDDAGFVQTVDLGYRQDLTSLQFGYDFGGEGLRAGLTGGYATSKVDFAAGDRAKFEAYNLGLYMDLRRGPFFANALFKADRSTVRTTLAAIGASDRFHADTYGGAVEAGYRFGGDAFYAEPAVSVTYVRSRFDDTGAFGAVVDFDPDSESRAVAALRLGGRRELGGRTLDLHLTAGAARSLGDDGGIDFITAARTASFADQRPGSYGLVRAGAALTSGPMTAFFEADVRSGGAYKGGSGRVGLKVSF